MWKFTKQQIEDFITFRQKQLPEHYSQQEEMRMIDHYCCTLLPALVKNDTHLQLTLVSYGVVLFKRFYMIKNIFEQQNLHQILLISNYLAMKLNGLQHSSIAKFVSIVKKKPKHERFVHWGEDLYAKYEMLLVQTLGYEIDVKPIYPIIVSVTHVLQIKELLEQFLYIQYEKELVRYFLRALQGFTIFTYKESVIALVVVECALRSICSELFLPNSIIVGPLSRPVKPCVQEKLKQYSLENKECGKLIIQQLNVKEINIMEHIQPISKLASIVHDTKDMPRENDKEYERYKQIKQKHFSQPMSVEFVEMKKQILNQ